jgi:hypothetical protein
MGFPKFKMNSEMAHLTASIGPRGFFQYERMAIGFKESPITFIRVMELAMAGLLRDAKGIYLDDTMVILETLDEYILRL